jgi:hypothetical protein
MKKTKQIVIASSVIVPLVLTVLYLLSFTLAPPTSIYPSLNKVQRSQSITRFQYSPNQTCIEFNPIDDPHFAIPFEKYFYWDQKIILKIKALKKITRSDLFLGFQGKSYAEKYKRQGVFVTELNGAVPRRTVPDVMRIEYRIPAGNYRSLRFDFESPADNRNSGSVTIEDVQFVPFPFYETVSFGYLLTILFACSLIIPGTLIYALFQKTAQHNNDRYLISFFSLSVLFYLFLFLMWELLPDFNMPDSCRMLVSFVGLTTILLGLALIFKKQSLLIHLLKSSKHEILIFILVTLVSFFIITWRTEQPFTSIDYQWIAYGKTFDAFRAHDNMFQFVNGKAIADNEPFEKYYAQRTLWYNVQDREMLPGVVYAVYRKIVGGFSVFLEKSYLTYTILGTCMNAMVIFPLIVLFRIYFGKLNIYLFSLFISLNAFVIVNYYYTWFKFTGAALYLSGLIILLSDYTKVRNWLAAGFLFGLSVNMHAGNALAIPLFFLWFAYLNMKSRKFKLMESFVQPITLVVVFFIVNLPWSVVKKVCFREDYALIKENYLYSVSSDAGLPASAILFFKMIPLQEQIALRFDHLISSLRFSRISFLFSLWFQQEWKFSLHYWNQTEFYYILPSIYPLLLFCIAGYYRSGELGIRNREFPIPNFPFQIPSVGTLFGISLLTSLMVIIASYSPNSSDLTYLNPMGTLLIIHTVLIGYIFNSGKLISILFSLYMVFTSLRLASSLL